MSTKVLDDPMGLAIFDPGAAKLDAALEESEQAFERRAANETAEVDQQVEQHANEIDGLKARGVEVILEIGEHLDAVHNLLAGTGRDGEFRPWIERRCGFSKSTAYRYLAVYERFNKCPTLGHFDAGALYRLAENSTPEEARQKAIDRAEGGERITEAVAEQIVEEVCPAGVHNYTRKAGQNRGVCEWYTPKEIIEAVRRTMGNMDLDPASCDMANETVQAGRFFDKDDDGLAQPWAGRVFLNPPFASTTIAAFVSKLADEIDCGNVSEAVLLTNNSTDAGWWHKAFVCCRGVCFTRGRISFYNANGEFTNNTNGQTVFYFGPNTEAFVREFRAFGSVLELAGRITGGDE